MKKMLLLVILTVMSASCMGQKVNNTPTKNFSLEKFLGTWYEISRFDHSFERGLNYCTAEYSMNDDGTLTVLNSGLKNGKYKSSKGKAKVTDTTGLLRVSFFGPFYSDYRVLKIWGDYRYALIGSGSDKYLWILSRTPEVPDNVLNEITDNAFRRGYKTENLIWVEQNVQGVNFE